MERSERTPLTGRPRGSQTPTASRPKRRERRLRRAQAELFGRWIAAALVAAHGVNHIVGLELVWHLHQPGLLHYRDIHPTAGSILAIAVGWTWLGALVLFLIAAVRIVRQRPWVPPAMAAVLLSLPNMVVNPHLGSAGLIADVLIALAATVTVVLGRRKT